MLYFPEAFGQKGLRDQCKPDHIPQNASSGDGKHYLLILMHSFRHKNIGKNEIVCTYIKAVRVCDILFSVILVNRLDLLALTVLLT